MEHHETRDHIETTDAFERTLEALVLSAYADGLPVEGTWDFAIPVADAPDWTVTIERSDSEEPAPYRPRFLEE